MTINLNGGAAIRPGVRCEKDIRAGDGCQRGFGFQGGIWRAAGQPRAAVPTWVRVGQNLWRKTKRPGLGLSRGTYVDQPSPKCCSSRSIRDGQQWVNGTVVP
jgi:hypothetical protein